MRKLTVNEYAQEFKKTPSNVYQQIKKGKLETEEIDGKRFILVEEKEEEDNSKIEIKYLKKEIKMLQDLVKSKQSEIDTLNSSLSVFSQIFNKQIEQQQPVQDVEIQETKKKKKGWFF